MCLSLSCSIYLLQMRYPGTKLLSISRSNYPLHLFCSFPSSQRQFWESKKFGEAGALFPGQRTAAPGPRVRRPSGLEGRLRGGQARAREGCQRCLGVRTCLCQARELHTGETGRPRRAARARRTPGEPCYSPSAVAIILSRPGAAGAL